MKSFDFNAARNNIKDAKKSVKHLAILKKEVRWFLFIIFMSDNNTKRFLQCLQGNRENGIYLLGQLPCFFSIENTLIFNHTAKYCAFKL